MLKIYRVLGEKGRITIPFEIRQRIGFRYNDVLSFAELDDSSVVVRKEKICDNCKCLEEDFEDNFTVCQRKNRETHFYIFLCCGQKKSRSLMFRLS